MLVKRVFLVLGLLVLLLLMWKNRKELNGFSHRLGWAAGTFIILGFCVRLFQWLANAP